MKRKWFIFGLAIGTATLAAGVFLLLNRDPLRAPVRKQWKAEAIAQIDQRVHDSSWLQSELERLKQQASKDSLEWFSENLILATNGDWMVCASKCNKEANRIHDIFIGRGSDGKWYYSTFHFCIGKLVLKTEEQPGSLEEFTESYFLREFDGRSDECLNQTWPRRN